MRIAYLAAGAAGMYCGSCLHDNTLAAALLRQGEDVILVPIYTPLRTDEVDVSQPRVFFGGINAYLQQKFAVFRRTPRWFDGWLDRPGILRLAAGRAASVDPAKLGDMTVSMLRGEEGHQLKELTKLVDWLLTEAKPDVVHLSNSMMLGLARMIRQRCGPPIVCSLSGEDIFLEKLRPPHYEEARTLLKQRAADADAFVALNEYYADFMSEYLQTPRDKVFVIPHGLNLDGHDPARVPAGDVPRIGYLARVCEDKGLHLLFEACELLAASDDVPPFELHAAGYLGAGDRPYLQSIKSRAARGSLAGRFHYHGELDRPGKIAFLQSLAIMSTPTVYRESKGLPVLEAWANGRPVVAPDHGAFPELFASAGGGVLHRAGDVADLAEKLSQLLQDPARGTALGEAGRRAIESLFNDVRMARETLALYERLVGDR